MFLNHAKEGLLATTKRKEKTDQKFLRTANTYTLTITKKALPNWNAHST